SERQELQEIRDRIAFRPTEVGVRHLTGPIANVYQQRRDRIWDGGALAAQHAVRPDPRPFHVEEAAELRRVARSDLEKQYRVFLRNVVRVARFVQFELVFLQRSVPGTVGTDPDG